MKPRGLDDKPAKAPSLLAALRDVDESRPSLPGEHWAAFGFGLYLLLRRRSSGVGRLASMFAGTALMARALSGRDGAIAMWRRAEAGDAANQLIDVAMPWPYEQRVRIARNESNDARKHSGKDHHRIDIAREEDVREWARKFDASPQQIKDAVEAVGARADDVELHLKGSRSTETGDRVRENLTKTERKPR
jgi:Protein of unknown function (DUF3606)